MAGLSTERAIETFDTIDAFSEAVQALPIPWDIESCQKKFSASIERKSVANADFASVAFSACKCERQGTDSRRGAAGYVCLTAQRKGLQRMTWGSRREVLAPNELMLWSAGKPMLLENDTDALAYNLWLPIERIERRVGDISDYIGEKLSVSEPSARMLVSHLGHLYSEADTFEPTRQDRLLDATIELIFSCFSPRQSRAETGLRSSSLFREALAYIANTDELAGLTPGAVASAMGISKRYLQHLFNQSGSTFSANIAKVRLERARSALQSAHFQIYNITEIAHHFGFFDCSHFNRSFKRYFGVTPSQFRRTN